MLVEYQREGGDMTDLEDDLRNFDVQIPQVRMLRVPSLERATQSLLM